MNPITGPASIDAAAAENYRAIKAERGCSWATLAAEHAHSDARLASWMRQQDALEQPVVVLTDPDAADPTPRARRGRPTTATAPPGLITPTS